MSPSKAVQEMIDLLTANFPPVGTTMLDADEVRRLLSAAPRRVPRPLPRVESADADGVAVRWYRPVADGTTTAGLVFFHGGGFVLCDLDSHDAICRDLAAACELTVVSVDYRLAPEDPYPAAVDDAYRATAWAHAHAGELGIDPQRLIVAGDSAGGNLALAVSLLARDRRGPALSAQVLLYPMLDPAQDTASYRNYGQKFFLTADHLRWYWGCYLDSATEPYRPPLTASLASLPPALVVVAGCDPLRDEGVAAADALGAAGVPFQLLEFDDLFHGFVGFGAQLEEVAVANEQIYAAIRELASARPPGAGSAEAPTARSS